MIAYGRVCIYTGQLYDKVRRNIAFAKFRRDPPTRALNRGGVHKFHDYLSNRVAVGTKGVSVTDVFPP